MYDIAIIGGGIVGLATGVKILQSRPDLKVVIFEKENELAKHQTANNSGVIHSGLYYKPGSLKAINCINGYHELIKFCNEEDIPFELTGKVVVATRKDQLHILDTLLERGLQNGLNGTRKITLEELKEFEPYCAGVGAIHVPQTGIVDYLKVALAYGKKIEQMGGEIFTGHKVLKIDQNEALNHIDTSNGSFKAKIVINCAGLYSDKVARLNDQSIDDVKIIPFRGEYYKLKKEKEYLVKNLIYPVPDPNFPFLGVHFTRMINGGREVGPNAVLALKREGYKNTDFSLNDTFDSLTYKGFLNFFAKNTSFAMGEFLSSLSKRAFVAKSKKLIPDLEEYMLVKGGTAGVRAQAISPKGELIMDFKIIKENNQIHILNAPSPGATASLSIAKYIIQNYI